MDAAYGKLLVWSLHHRRMMGIGVVVASAAFSPPTSARTVPDDDQGIQRQHPPAQGQLPRTEEFITPIEKKIWRCPT